jgi:hypothetical protein
MKKTNKPATTKSAPKQTAAKKPTAKKLAAKKSSSKPKRKAAGQGDLAQVLDRIANDQRRIIDKMEQLAQLVEKLVAIVDRLMQAEEAGEPPPEDPEDIVRQPPVSDEVARMAQWLCLKCEALFPGEALFDRNAPGERLDRCPTCGSDNIAIPDRIEHVDQG